ncbi:hypothetical protein BDZ94DRAFT_1248178 [Collybia nuda]|uniref:Uncharacterized protein n=1 Tax=Collybia nuda TaxID=64659 RepID=A0A9P5YG11_9AGAR|nr:hypothetical protein BDZ94DRAFT_1248164 [Collybia nuda]KAF9467954.1 hypothetical protein BDZ94DRAFT_1248178 [Collybia nuda]
MSANSRGCGGHQCCPSHLKIACKGVRRSSSVITHSPWCGALCIRESLKVSVAFHRVAGSLWVGVFVCMVS